MPGLLLRRKHRSLVIDQEIPAGNDHHAVLPPELWGYIAEFLDLQDLSRVYLVNHAFYDAFLSRKFRTVKLVNVLASLAKQELALFKAMQNPLIKGKIRELHIDNRRDGYLIFAFDSEGWESYFPRHSWSRLALLMSGRMKKAKRRALKEIIQGAASKLNVTRLFLVLYHPFSNSLVLDTFWTTCSQTIVHLTLTAHCFARNPDHRLGLDIPCPHLRSLHIIIVAHAFPYSEILNGVRSLIPEDGGSLEQLSVSIHGNKVPLRNFSFGRLRNLQLGDPEGMPSILPFITLHRDTLEEITLGRGSSMDLRNITLLNANILTSLSAFIEPFLQSQDEIYPFLSRCSSLRTLSLSHDHHLGSESSAEQTLSFPKLLSSLPPSLTHLTFPGILLDFKLLLSIFQRLPNVSSLTLSDCYPANEEIRIHFCQERSGQAKWAPLSEESCLLVIENIPRAQLTAFIQGDLDESGQEGIFKLLVGTMACSWPCCNSFPDNHLVT